MIKTWISDVRPLLQEDIYRQFYDQVPDFRKRKADKIRAASGRALSIGAWALLDKVRTTYGISDRATFNISHSGECVLFSVDIDECPGTKVGCDIEKVGGVRLEVAKRFYCPSEYRRILAEPTEEFQADVFYRFWVLKESFMKATRLGMAMDMTSFEVELGPIPQLVSKPVEIKECYYYREYEISEVPYRIAVCSTDENIDSEIQMEFMTYEK